MGPVGPHRDSRLRPGRAGIGTRIVLERQQEAVAELRALGAAVPRTRSLVDELLAERRIAAAAE